MYVFIITATIIQIQIQSTEFIKRHTFLNKVYTFAMESGGPNQKKAAGSPTVGECDSRTEEDQLWKKCNELFHSDKKITKFSITSLIIHIAVLVFVTLSVS